MAFKSLWIVPLILLTGLSSASAQDTDETITVPSLEPGVVEINVDNPPENGLRLDSASPSRPPAPLRYAFIRFGKHWEGFSFYKTMRQCADTPNYFCSVCDVNHVTRLGRADVFSPDVVGYRTVMVEADDIRGISDGAKYVASVYNPRPGQVHIRGKGSQPARDPTVELKPPLLILWEMQNGAYHLLNAVRLISEKGDFNYGTVWPMGVDRVIVVRNNEGLYLINIAQARLDAFCKTGFDDPWLAPGGQAIAYVAHDRLRLLRTSDLSIAASVTLQEHDGNVSIDPTCTYAAYRRGPRAHIVKISTGEEVASVMLGPDMGDIILLSPDFLAADRDWGWEVYDVKSGFPFWHYNRKGVNDFKLLASGQLLLQFDDGEFALATIPDRPALAAFKHFDPKQYAVVPGTAIVVKGNPGVFNCSQEQMMAACAESLNRSGLQLASSDSHVALTWTSSPGPSKTVKYEETAAGFGPGFIPTPFGNRPIGPVVGAPTDITVPSTVVSFAISLDGKAIWSSTVTLTAPGAFRTDKTKSLQDQVNDFARPTVDTLRSFLSVPAYIARDKSHAGGSSTISVAGIREDNP